jgi:hypothetical protein
MGTYNSRQQDVCNELKNQKLKCEAALDRYHKGTGTLEAYNNADTKFRALQNELYMVAAGRVPGNF